MTLLGVERAEYRAGIDMAGAAMTWKVNPLQAVMLKRPPRMSTLFFFQAENDYACPHTRSFSGDEGAADRTRRRSTIRKGLGDGHGLVVRGITLWFDDAMKVLASHCQQAELLLPREMSSLHERTHASDAFRTASAMSKNRTLLKGLDSWTAATWLRCSQSLARTGLLAACDGACGASHW
ncbi:MAG TPA: hypothetical protein VGF45_21875 [Polyangia bacterium]